MATSLGRFYAIFGADTSEFTRKMGALGTKMGAIGKKMTMGLTLPLVALAGIAVKSFAEFEQAIANAASVAGGTTEQYVRNLKEMEKIARDMGATTVFSAKEAADGLYFMASAGWDVNKMGKAIKPTLDLAAATQNDLAFTTETVVAALSAFGMEASEATRVTDTFSGVISSSQATLDKLSNSMTYIGPLAKNLGWSIEQTSAALGLLYDKGIPASTAGTALRMSMQKLLDPTDKVHQGLATLGLTIDDVDPKFKTLDEIVDTFSKTSMDATAVTQIFGARGMAAILGLTSAGAPALVNLTEKISKTGTTAEMARRQLDTMKGGFKLLTSALSEVAIQIGQILQPTVEKMVGGIRNLVTGFGELPGWLKKGIVAFGGLLAVIGPALSIFGKFTSAIAGMSAKWLAILGPIGLVVAALILVVSHISKVIKNFKRLKEAEASMAGFDEAAGRSAGFLKKFFTASKEYGQELTTFAMLIEKKYSGDVNKALQALEDGTIKRAKSMEKLKERLFGMMIIEKKLAEERQEAAAEEEKAQKKEAQLLFIQTRNREANTAVRKAAQSAAQALTGTEVEMVGALAAAETALKEATFAESGFKDALQAVIDKLKASLGATEAYTARVESLSLVFKSELKKEIEDAKWALEEFGDKLAPGKVKELEDKIKDLRLQLRGMTGEIEKFPEVIIPEAVPEIIDDTSKSLEERLFPALFDTNREANKLGDDSIPKITWNTKLMKGETERAAKATRDLGKSFEEINKTGSEVFSNLAIAFGLLGDELGGGFGDFLKLGAVALDQIGAKFKELGETAGMTGKKLLEAIGPQLAGQIGASIGGLISGTKKNFGQLGATIGGTMGGIFGPIGKVVGSVFGGLIGGLFKKGKTEAEKAAEEAAQLAKQLEAQTQEAIQVMSKYGEITDSTAKKIAELRKEHEGYIAESLAFADVIKDVGVSQENLNALWKASIGIIHQVSQGQIDAAIGGKVLSDVFTEMKNGAIELGKEGSAGMVAFILEARNLGIEIKSVTEYVLDQLGKIPAALDTLVSQVAEGNNEELERLGGLAAATFNSMMASGQSWHDSLAAMAPTISALRAKYDEMGIEATGALAKLFKVSEVTEANKELFEAIDANNIILEALGNTGWLTAQDFKGFADQAIADFETLRKKFGDDDLALRAMAPTLQNLADNAETYGYKLDDNTQRLVDQAIKMGYVTLAQETEQEQQERLFGDLGEKMAEIMQKLGDRIEDIFASAFGSAATSGAAAAADIDRSFSGKEYTVKVGYEFDTSGEPRFSGINVPVTYGGRGNTISGPGLQHGGIQFNPQIKRVAEIEPEIWTPFSKVKDLVSGIAEGLAMGGGGTNVFQFAPVIKAMDSQDVYKFMSGRGREAFVKMIQTNPRGITQEIKTQTDKFRGQSSSSQGKGRGKKK